MIEKVKIFARPGSKPPSSTSASQKQKKGVEKSGATTSTVGSSSFAVTTRVTKQRKTLNSRVAGTVDIHAPLPDARKRKTASSRATTAEPTPVERPAPHSEKSSQKSKATPVAEAISEEESDFDLFERGLQDTDSLENLLPENGTTQTAALKDQTLESELSSDESLSAFSTPSQFPNSRHRTITTGIQKLSLEKAKMPAPTPEMLLDPEATFPDAETMPKGSALPTTFSRNRPRYNSDDEESILEYLKQCEEVHELCDVKTDRIKKKIVVHFLKSQEQELWTRMETYRKGTYKAFKDEILRYHPKAYNSRKGGLERLRKLAAEYRGLTTEDYEEVRLYTLKFRTEADKVFERKEAGHRELAEIFFSSFSVYFRDKIWDEVERLRETAEDLYGDAEIPYTEIVKAAEGIVRKKASFKERFGSSRDTGRGLYYPEKEKRPSTGSSARQVTEEDIENMRKVPSGLGGVWPGNTSSVKEEPDFDALEKRLTRVLEQKLQDHTSVVKDTLNDIRSAKDQVEILLRNPHNFAVATQQNRAPRPQFGAPPMNRGMSCFYCAEQGHRIMDCPVRMQHEKEGKIKTNGVATFLPNNDRLYGTAEDPIKSQVERASKTAGQNYMEAQYVQHLPEGDWVSREDFTSLQNALEMLALQCAPPPASKPTPQPRETTDSVGRLQNSQDRTNKLLEQLVGAFAKQEAQPQFQLLTRSGKGREEEEDFQ